MSEYQPKQYEICIKGHIDPCWSEWLENMKVTQTTSGETILSGPIADQSALHGLLAKIRDMNLELISIARIESELSVHKNINKDG